MAGDELESLITRAREGDEAAREELYLRYEPRLRRVLSGRLGKDLRVRIDTDDLMQSTLGVTLRDLDGLEFRGEEAFEGWLVQAATHRLLDAARRNRAGARDVARQRPLQAAAGRAAGFTTPTRSVERGEVTLDVQAAVARLEPEDRRIVELRSYEGLPFSEIANLVRLPGKDAARDRYRRALRKMGTLLGKHRERPPESR